MLRAESGRRALEIAVGESIDQQTGFAGDFEYFVAPAVDELGAELDRKRPAAHAPREDPPARPGAGFEDDDRETGSGKTFGGGEAGGARPDDEDVERSLHGWRSRISGKDGAG